MSKKVISTTIQPGQTIVTLPDRTTHSAQISFEFVGSDNGVTLRQNPANSAQLKVVNSPSLPTQLVIEIEQDEPFSEYHCSPVAPWDKNRSYPRYSQVFMYGRIYIANSFISQGTPFKTSQNMNSASGWVNASGDSAMILETFSSFDVSDGYWPTDGSIINAPWSFMHGTRAPDLRGKYFIQNNGSQIIGTTFGSNSVTLQQGHLPSVTYNPRIIQNSGDGQSETVYIPYDLTGNPDGARDSDGSVWNRQYWRGYTQKHLTIFNAPHTHACSFDLNPSGQSAIDITPPSIVVQRFIRL